MEKLVPTWMRSAPTSAQKAEAQCATPSSIAIAVPTTTGATAAHSVLGRAANVHVLTGEGVSDKGGGFALSGVDMAIA